MLKTGTSARSRSSVCVPPGVVIVRLMCRPDTVPVTCTAPVPGSSEKSNERSANSRSTCADVWISAGVVSPSSDIWRRASSSSSKPSAAGLVWLTLKPIFSPR